jgi:hypothetical protein
MKLVRTPHWTVHAVAAIRQLLGFGPSINALV